MATIGSVTKRDDGRYEGELRTLSIRADITILPVGRQGLAEPARLPRAVARHRDRCRLAAHRPDLRQGVRLAVDLRTRVRRQDALRQPRPCRGSDRSRRLRADLEPARLSAHVFALAPATARGLFACFSAGLPHPPTPRGCMRLVAYCRCRRSPRHSSCAIASCESRALTPSRGHALCSPSDEPLSRSVLAATAC